MRAKSLRGELRRAAMLTMLLATLLGGGALLTYELLTFRNAWANDLQTQADLISRATAAALVFNDPQMAQENLALLKIRPGIAGATIYGRDGAVVATYSRTPGEAMPARAGNADGRAHFDGSEIDISYPIAHDGERVGTLYLRAQHNIWSKLISYAVILGVIGVASLAFAYYLFDRLQAHVTTPLVRMTAVAEQVITTSDWALRAPETEYQDVRVLVHAFNGMLSEVGNRTSELERQMAIREKAEHDLRLADRRKDEFLATLAHELRNPLAPMMNAVALLELPSLTADARASAITILGRQLRHMVRLIDDLLDASRMAMGKLSLLKQAVDLTEVVRSAGELAQPAAARNGLTLNVALPSASLWVDGDPVRLAQVFSNLLNNACRYTPPGGTIDVALHADDGGATVSVRDTGIGVAAEMQERIFDLFEQADKSLERGSAGLGIGLTLARQLVGLHGGSISLASDGAGRGSCFTVSLSLAPPRPQATAAAMAPPPRATGLEILVADDNVDLAESFAEILRLEGHHVRIANDGDEALSATARRVPDVAFLDIGMPGKNGYEVARLLRAGVETRGIYLVAVTGWGQPADKANSDRAGFDLHVVKPVEPSVVLKILAGAPERRAGAAKTPT